MSADEAVAYGLADSVITIIKKAKETPDHEEK